MGRSGRRLGEVGGDLKELWDLVVAYARQETVEPLKGLLRFVGFGLAGSLVGGFGLVLVLLGFLRLLQSETGSTFAGRWSWVPYIVTLMVAVSIAAGAVSARGRRKESR
jgi:hypothetical protein